MNFGIFLLFIANLANGYLLNSIPLEKLMQKAMTAGKRSEVKTGFWTFIFMIFRRWWNVEQITHRLHIKSQCGYSWKLTELRIKIITILFINKTFACIFENLISVKSTGYCYKFADFKTEVQTPYLQGPAFPLMNCSPLYDEIRFDRRCRFI